MLNWYQYPVLVKAVFHPLLRYVEHVPPAYKMTTPTLGGMVKPAPHDQQEAMTTNLSRNSSGMCKASNSLAFPLV